MNKKDKGEVRDLIIGASKTDIDRLERRLIARENQADGVPKKVEIHEKLIKIFGQTVN